MKQNILSKYLSIIFIVATLMGSFHHHDTLDGHNDCQVCTLQHNLASGDTPQETSYITSLDIISETIISTNFQVLTYENFSYLQARAPPFFS